MSKEKLHDKNGHAIDKNGKLTFDKECLGCDAPMPHINEEWAKKADDAFEFFAGNWTKSKLRFETKHFFLNYCRTLRLQALEQGRTEGREEAFGDAIEAMKEYFEKQMFLFDGKLPFAIFMGKAGESEKIAIYKKGVNDSIAILSKLREV